MGAQSSTGVWFVQVCIRTSTTEYQASFLYLVWAWSTGQMWLGRPLRPDGRMPMQSIDPSGRTGNGLGHIWASRGMGIGGGQHFLFCLLTLLPFGNYPCLYVQDTVEPPFNLVPTLPPCPTEVHMWPKQAHKRMPLCWNQGKVHVLGLMTQIEHIRVFLQGWNRSHAVLQGASFLSLERFGRI